jgi:hypothetical protein
MGLVDGADTALSSLAIRHEGLPLHGHINTDTVLATTKLDRPSHLPSGCGRCRKGAQSERFQLRRLRSTHMTGKGRRRR